MSEATRHEFYPNGPRPAELVAVDAVDLLHWDYNNPSDRDQLIDLIAVVAEQSFRVGQRSAGAAWGEMFRRLSTAGSIDPDAVRSFMEKAIPPDGVTMAPNERRE